ncbi:Prolyl 3,4-dihydroxylase ofd1 [Sparassis crispa]|uniref:Prolyl 3,4-dihydroxylase ofd1 n=1 Tax=Sparassis crispa TaxID=139825 RepID=A0A401GBR4_9APHY|nr:Prolyl 3,4-dihydroxylase ofd1 [Sparassis crispa]GBE79614.1 Prolyl 3,4-dihydroxylase ofd1 [Sparassis crispa]
MGMSHDRSPSPDPEPVLLKRLKISHSSSSSDVSEHFSPGLFAPANIYRLHNEYVSSVPFKHVLVEKLFQEELLKGVKQTGDLASLSFLSDAQIALLPHLLTLRDALYSAQFRNFLRAVTGCGPLSGTKQDMSVVSYSKSCHLLTHDDVIGTRRVSYILYMPLPNYRGWESDWGGALELYPTKLGPEGIPEPEPIPAKSIPPSWNQFIFFEVQPGKSFHSVEEVVVGEAEDGRQRLSISGWFHSAQPGEEGYQPESAPAVKSSREQLTSTSTEFSTYPAAVPAPLPDDALSAADASFLSEFLNPVYLQARTMKALASRFIDESSLELHSFLCAPLAEKLEHGLSERDAQDGLGPGRATRIPPHVAGTDGAWTARGPPHKWRYCVQRPEDPSAPRMARATDPRWLGQSTDEIVHELETRLFPSAPFRAWLAAVSRLLPLRYAVEARRFRPGLDYTLATSEAKDTRLDVVLGLTPQTSGRENKDVDAAVDRGTPAEDAPCAWQTGEWGGWECYMAPHDEEDDPAVYRTSTKHLRSTEADGPGGADENSNEGAKRSRESADRMSDGSSAHEEAEDEEEDTGTLLTVQASFNRLLLVLRDEGVMHFVKYVSAAAQGSRWDVCGEYEIGVVEEEE